MRTEKTIRSKKCFIYENGAADTLLIQAIDEHDLEQLDREAELIKQLSPAAQFTLAAFLVDDWNRELSPWNAPAVFGREAFGSDAAQTLSFVADDLLPEISSTDKSRLYLGGYSLSGLFALWSAYQTDIFCGIAAVSPSVWFPGWQSYADSHSIRTAEIYLSLGTKEEKTKNKVMSSVGDSIRHQHELLCGTDTVKRCTLEWNQGGHFVDPALRTAKGFAWLLNG